MTNYTLAATRSTLHGVWDNSLEPVLHLDPGDTVVFQTIDANWEAQAPEGLRMLDFTPDPVQTWGHALTGPLYIRGAEPGMALEVQIGELQPGDWGWIAVTPSEQNRRMGVTERNLVLWQIDNQLGTATAQFSTRLVTLPIRPFLGVLGNALDQPGTFSTVPPRWVGGNLDCKELVSGSTLWLPVAVPGALFSAGDGHALQADGENSGVAIEVPMPRAELTFALRTDLALTRPRALAPSGWITFGFHESLNVAAEQALGDMLNVIMGQIGLTRPEALALSSLVVDLRVTQVVNGERGVHAVLPLEALATLS
jgi:acetamidase/formamidase